MPIHVSRAYCYDGMFQGSPSLDHAGHKVTLIQEEAEAQKIEIAGLIQTPLKRQLESKDEDGHSN